MNNIEIENAAAGMDDDDDERGKSRGNFRPKEDNNRSRRDQPGSREANKQQRAPVDEEAEGE